MRRMTLLVPLCCCVLLWACCVQIVVPDSDTLGDSEFDPGTATELAFDRPTLLVSLGNLGTIALQPGRVTFVPAAVQLFGEPPETAPSSGILTVQSNSVAIAERLPTGVNSAVTPLNGTGHLRISIASGQSVAACDSATLLAEYDFTLTYGVIGLVNEDYNISRAALDIIATNDVTLCMEVSADFEADIMLGDLEFSFGGSDGSPPPRAVALEPPPPASSQFVTIDNVDGRAVSVAPNRTIAGVPYAVVGVLEAVTPDVAVPTANPSEIDLDLDTLGLWRVQRLYMGVHSSFVADVSGGVAFAQLTVDYEGSGAPTIANLVLGESTAEWSYDRPEHAVFGGVQHDRAAVLYSFPTAVDSASMYTGYSYSVVLDLDAARRPTRITLDMAPVTSLAAQRADNAPEPTWAGQAVTAMTLEAITMPPPPVTFDGDIVACCLGLDCVEAPTDLCRMAGGSTMDAETCSDVQCDDPNEDDDDSDMDPVTAVTGACCHANGSCSDTDSADCATASGTYQGTGTRCSELSCAVADWVVWHTGNVCCWGAPLVYISERSGFESPALRSSFPGGGINPTTPVTKVELRGGFLTKDDAQDWVCPRFDSRFNHFWCGSSYSQMDGANWQPTGSLGCDISPLPFIDSADVPDRDVCSESSGTAPPVDPDDDPPATNPTVACCYPNTTCVEQEEVDCRAAGGVPQPNAMGDCTRAECADPCPRDGLCDTDCPRLTGDPDCDNCGYQGSTLNCVIEGCDSVDRDCCSSETVGDRIMLNGDAEDTALLTSSSEANPARTWKITNGPFTTLSYGDDIAFGLDETDAVAIGGGQRYFAGGQGRSRYSTARHYAVIPLWLGAFNRGDAIAVISAHLGGWHNQDDHMEVTVLFRPLVDRTIMPPVGAPLTIGPVTAADRGNQTRLVYREEGAVVPPGVWFAEIVLTATKFQGTSNDAYADNVELTIRCLDN